MASDDSLGFLRRSFLKLASIGGAVASIPLARAKDRASMHHIVLLGDSVFDNAAYVGSGPDVITQLRQRIPSAWRASLLAVDGSIMADIPAQLARLPADASHLVISVGGNDALRDARILDAPSRSVADSLLKLADIRQRFLTEYSAMMDAVLKRGLSTAACTIYDPRYPDPARRIVAIAALAIINDGIIRETVGRGVPLLDLRAVCDEDADFANPIEPSVQGGRKIVNAITSLVMRHDFGRTRTEIFTR